jgi:hypothetical protein
VTTTTTTKVDTPSRGLLTITHRFEMFNQRKCRTIDKISWSPKNPLVQHALAWRTHAHFPKTNEDPPRLDAHAAVEPHGGGVGGVGGGGGGGGGGRCFAAVAAAAAAALVLAVVT